VFDERGRKGKGVCFSGAVLKKLAGEFVFYDFTGKQKRGIP